MNPIIRTDNLTLHFGDIIAVDHLTFEINPGEIFGFLGHNGAGKTTTIRLLNGILSSDRGTARVLDLSPWSDGPDLRRRTGILTETPSLDERLTGLENLTIFANLFNVPRSEIPARVDELLETFGLTDRADDLVGGYSRGMKQRLALARAMLHKPEILFLDEPSAGLDPVATHRLHTLITRLSHEEKHTVFLCTHNLAEAQRLCDRVAVLDHGRLVALGSPIELSQKLGGELRLEIEVSLDASSAAVDILHSTQGITGITDENGHITVKVADRELIPDLVATLAEAKVRLYQVSLQEPTLEDFYFTLHGEEEVQS